MRKLGFTLLFAFVLVGSAYGQSVQQSGTISNNHSVKWITNGVIGDGGLGFTELVNGNFTILLDTAGHIRDTGATPALGTCGTSPSITGTDVAGTVTMGTASPTGCVITFATTYTSAPNCLVTWQTNIASMIYTVSASAITLTQTGTSSNKVNYICRGQSGG